MTKFTGTDATQAIINFLMTNSGTLPEAPRNMITETLASRDLLRSLITTMEALYSARAQTPEGVELLRDLADFVQANNFYGMSERAQAIMTVAERLLSGGEPELINDPEVSSEFASKPDTALEEVPTT